MTTGNAGDEPRWAVWVARAVAVVVVVPVTLVWGWCAAVARWVGRVLRRWLGVPLGRALRWVARGLERVLRAVFAPVGRALRAVLGWVGRGTRAVLGRVGRVLRAVLAPVGRVLRAVFDRIRAPAGLLLRWLWREVVARLGRAVWAVLKLFFDAVGWAFARVDRAFTALGVLLRRLVVVPARRVHRAVLAPVGRALRRVWSVVVVAPARRVRRSVLDPVRSAGRRIRARVSGSRR